MKPIYMAQELRKRSDKWAVMKNITMANPGLDVGRWVYIIIGAMVLIIIVAALWTTFLNALTNYSTNETTFGPTLKQITPILIGVGILLAFVSVFLAYARFGHRGA